MSFFTLKHSFGLDISDYSVEILELSNKNKVIAFNRIILEPGIIKNGLILEKKLLVEKLKKLIAKTHLSTNQVVLCLPESKVFIHIFKIPKGLKGKHLKDVVSFDMWQFLKKLLILILKY